MCYSVPSTNVCFCKIFIHCQRPNLENDFNTTRKCKQHIWAGAKKGGFPLALLGSSTNNRNPGNFIHLPSFLLSSQILPALPSPHQELAFADRSDRQRLALSLEHWSSIAYTR